MTDGNMNSRPRVMFVDDEPGILMAVRALFRSEYEVVTVSSGEEAVRLLKERDFDVIVSDQRMPKMTGVEVLRAARELRPQATRILLTGYSDLQAVVGSINEGEIFRFVSKPWTNQELRATLGSAVELRAGQAEADNLDETASGRSGSSVSREEIGVLILEPDKEIRERLALVLQGTDHPTYTAATVEEALECLRRHSIGVLITELMIDDESIVVVLNTLRKHYPGLVPLIITTHTDASHCIDLINQGQVYRLLQKPIGDSLLRGTLRMASARYQMLSRNPDFSRRIQDHSVKPPEEVQKRSGLLARIKQLLVSTG